MIEVTERLTSSAAELSRTASEAGTSMQKALLSVKERPRLNLNSEAVKFFGLKSYRDMAFAQGEMLTKFKMDRLGCKSLNPEDVSDSFRRGCSNLVTLFKEIKVANDT